jgi:hypothetical protein
MEANQGGRGDQDVNRPGSAPEDRGQGDADSRGPKQGGRPGQDNGRKNRPGGEGTGQGGRGDPERGDTGGGASGF